MPQKQTLFRQVANVAKRFSESDIPDEQKKKYLDAAQQFRLPYWDYYRPRAYTKTTFPGVTNPDDGTTTAPYDWGAPQIFTMPEVMVKRLPDNKPISMPNPFFKFEFSPDQLNKIKADQDPNTKIEDLFVSITLSLKESIVDSSIAHRRTYS